MGYSPHSGRGPMTHRKVSIATTAIEVSLGELKEGMTIQNTGGSIIYIGGSDVASDDYGFRLVPSQIYEFVEVKKTFSFYARCGAGTSTTLGVAEYA